MARMCRRWHARLRDGVQQAVGICVVDAVGRTAGLLPYALALGIVAELGDLALGCRVPGREVRTGAIPLVLRDRVATVAVGIDVGLLMTRPRLLHQPL